VDGRDKPGHDEWLDSVLPENAMNKNKKAPDRHPGLFAK
jgi:hypothetical protein